MFGKECSWIFSDIGIKPWHFSEINTFKSSLTFLWKGILVMCFWYGLERNVLNLFAEFFIIHSDCQLICCRKVHKTLLLSSIMNLTKSIIWMIDYDDKYMHRSIPELLVFFYLIFSNIKMLIFWLSFILYVLQMSGKNGFWKG